ncbi:hypothetical protein Micbo1qcDRAFT_179684 [Microdochium bolleyi]|uniref:Uncharacterized protein n=1 Tax=Microdochium bolleyi TaxID=196109 RepID=A0A136IP65_9PEZI|nr:hypothetical protein Micbo1qcDRAFT_179684 [Microdochium bolleyi]
MAPNQNSSDRSINPVDLRFAGEHYDPEREAAIEELRRGLYNSPLGRFISRNDNGSPLDHVHDGDSPPALEFDRNDDSPPDLGTVHGGRPTFTSFDEGAVSPLDSPHSERSAFLSDPSPESSPGGTPTPVVDGYEDEEISQGQSQENQTRPSNRGRRSSGHWMNRDYDYHEPEDNDHDFFLHPTDPNYQPSSHEARRHRDRERSRSPDRAHRYQNRDDDEAYSHRYRGNRAQVGANSRLTTIARVWKDNVELYKSFKRQRTIARFQSTAPRNGITYAQTPPESMSGDSSDGESLAPWEKMRLEDSAYDRHEEQRAEFEDCIIQYNEERAAAVEAEAKRKEKEKSREKRRKRARAEAARNEAAQNEAAENPTATGTEEIVTDPASLAIPARPVSEMTTFSRILECAGINSQLHQPQPQTPTAANEPAPYDLRFQDMRDRAAVTKKPPGPLDVSTANSAYRPWNIRPTSSVYSQDNLQDQTPEEIGETISSNTVSNKSFATCIKNWIKKPDSDEREKTSVSRPQARQGSESFAAFSRPNPDTCGCAQPYDNRPAMHTPFTAYFHEHGIKPAEAKNKQLFGPGGFLEDTAQVPEKAEPEKSIMSTIEGVFKKAKNKAVDLRASMTSTDLTLEHSRNKVNPIKITLRPREQCQVITEIELTSVEALTFFLHRQELWNRMDPAKMKKIVDKWVAEGNTVPEFYRYNLTTQIEICLAHVETFRFFGPAQNNTAAVSAVLDTAKKNARIMSLRTFGQPDSVIARLIIDSQKFLVLLDAEENSHRMQSLTEVAQFFHCIVERDEAVQAYGAQKHAEHNEILQSQRRRIDENPLALSGDISHELHDPCDRREQGTYFEYNGRCGVISDETFQEAVDLAQKADREAQSYMQRKTAEARDAGLFGHPVPAPCGHEDPESCLHWTLRPESEPVPSVAQSSVAAHTNEIFPLPFNTNEVECQKPCDNEAEYQPSYLDEAVPQLDTEIPGAELNFNSPRDTMGDRVLQMISDMGRSNISNSAAPPQPQPSETHGSNNLPAASYPVLDGTTALETPTDNRFERPDSPTLGFHPNVSFATSPYSGIHAVPGSAIGVALTSDATRSTANLLSHDSQPLTRKRAHAASESTYNLPSTSQLPSQG